MYTLSWQSCSGRVQQQGGTCVEARPPYHPARRTVLQRPFPAPPTRRLQALHALNTAPAAKGSHCSDPCNSPDFGKPCAHSRIGRSSNTRGALRAGTLSSCSVSSAMRPLLGIPMRSVDRSDSLVGFLAAAAAAQQQPETLPVAAAGRDAQPLRWCTGEAALYLSAGREFAKLCPTPTKTLNTTATHLSCCRQCCCSGCS